jgi:hypothetical protein
MNFVQFLPHARPSDPQAVPPVLYGIWLFMTILLFGVFSVFGTHTLLWAVHGYLVPAVAPLMKYLRTGAGTETSSEAGDEGGGNEIQK